MNDIEKLRSFYENEGEEELRLTQSGVHKLEFLTATSYLDRFLPPNSRILDNCAGSGAYSFYLADRGHKVTAGDIVQYNVDVMREKQKTRSPLAGIYEGDALNLEHFADESFDAVLLMGLLYHFDDLADWSRAITESLRVLKRGGIFVCTYMNRHAVIVNNAVGGLENIDEIMQFLSDGREGVFYASTPSEAERLVCENGVEQLCHIALDGMACLMRETSKLLDDEGLKRWGQYHLASCTNPSLLGYSYHNMIIGKRPQ